VTPEKWEKGLKLQVSATQAFHSLYDWFYQTTWLFSGGPEDPAGDTVREMHSANVLYPALKSSIHAIQTEDGDDHQNAAHWTIQMVKLWMTRRWREFKVANCTLPVRVANEHALLVDLVLPVDE